MMYSRPCRNRAAHEDDASSASVSALTAGPLNRSITLNVILRAGADRAIASTRPTNTAGAFQYAEHGASVLAAASSVTIHASASATAARHHIVFRVLDPTRGYLLLALVYLLFTLVYLLFTLVVRAVGGAVHGSSGHGCLG